MIAIFLTNLHPMSSSMLLNVSLKRPLHAQQDKSVTSQFQRKVLSHAVYHYIFRFGGVLNINVVEAYNKR